MNPSQQLDLSRSRAGEQAIPVGVTRTPFDDLHDALRERGRILVFIDDSESNVPPFPPGGLALYGCVAFKSEDYLGIERQVRSLVSSFPAVAEFHACDVVNAPNRTPWRSCELAERIHLFRLVADCLVEYHQAILRMHVRADQYSEMREVVIARGRTPVRLYKEGLRHVLYVPLLEELRVLFPDREVVLIQDNQTKKDCFEGFLPATSRVLCGGVFHLASDSLAGLQLADLAAYSFLRWVTQRHKGSPLGPFEEIICDLLNRCSTKPLM